jgi:hypothetical protein
MPLPNYNIRSDSFGNYYLGGFQLDSYIEAGYGTGASITCTSTDWTNFLTSAWGSTNWASSGGYYYLRPPSTFEPFTSQVSSSANWRYRLQEFSGSWYGSLNSSLTGVTVCDTSLGIPSSNGLFNSGNCAYGVANSHSLILACVDKGNAGILGTSSNMVYLGWLKDSLFATNDVERIRNFVSGKIVNENTGLENANGPNDTTRRVLGVGSTITCSVSTPGANVSDVVPICQSVNNLALGKMHNLVVYNGTLTIGQLYKIPAAQDPDGNTEQNIWLCVRDSIYGYNGSTYSSTSGKSILMRVWSSNIT